MSPRLSAVLSAPALALSTLCATLPSWQFSPSGRIRVAVFWVEALALLTTNSMTWCPQDKESGLQDNAGLIFRWFACSVVT